MYFNLSPQNKKIIKIFLPVIIALMLIFVISPAVASPQFHASTIEYLDGKGETVMEFAAVTASVSAGLSAIPGDAATPIADQLAQMSVYFLIVMCALYLEKYLIVITGCLSFKFLMPAACILLSIYFFTDKQKIKQLAVKLFVFSLAIFIAVPVSVKASKMIEETYRITNEQFLSVQDNVSEEAAAPEEEKDEGWFSAITGFFSDSMQNASDGASRALENARNYMGNTVEFIAVTIVTSCLIPICVFMFFIWISKSVIGMLIPQNKPNE